MQQVRARPDDDRALDSKLGQPRGRDLKRSEEHTSELPSQSNLVCRLLLEKKRRRVPEANLIYQNDKHHAAACHHKRQPYRAQLVKPLQRRRGPAVTWTTLIPHGSCEWSRD